MHHRPEVSRVRTQVTDLGDVTTPKREPSQDNLAYFGLGASNGPVETISGRLEHLRHRPGIHEPGTLHLQVTDPLRAAAGPDQRTLNREEHVEDHYIRQHSSLGRYGRQHRVRRSCIRDQNRRTRGSHAFGCGHRGITFSRPSLLPASGRVGPPVH